MTTRKSVLRECRQVTFAAITGNVLAMNIANPAYSATIAGDSASPIIQQVEDGSNQSAPRFRGEGLTGFLSHKF